MIKQQTYTDKVSDYITNEYGIEKLKKLLNPEYAARISALLTLNELNGRTVKYTADALISFLENVE